MWRNFPSDPPHHNLNTHEDDARASEEKPFRDKKTLLFSFNSSSFASPHPVKDSVLSCTRTEKIEKTDNLKVSSSKTLKEKTKKLLENVNKTLSKESIKIFYLRGWRNDGKISSNARRISIVKMRKFLGNKNFISLNILIF